MPRRIILHAGFHKTGTSSVQTMLRKNRAVLKPRVALRLPAQITDLTHATRGYSTWRDPLTMIKVQDRFLKLMEDLPGMPRRTLIVSDEALAGHLPGRGDLADYSAAPELLYALWEIAHNLFPAAQIVIYLSTRKPEPWLRSAHWEHVKSSSMTLDFEPFAARYASAANLDAMVAEIASRVPAHVHAVPLEDAAAHPLGPAGPLLDLCDLPDDVCGRLVTVPPANRGQDAATLQALLDANRTITDKDTRRDVKKAIVAGRS